MHIFVTGTDTNIGKTIVSSWICLHTGYDYFKPIQSGSIEGLDSDAVKNIANVHIHKETYIYKQPLSPHLAAHLENNKIELSNIHLPNVPNLIIEGAGGVLVPLSEDKLMIDLIKQTGASVILVARSTIGTINHTLLSLEALRARDIPILGVIVNGAPNESNNQAIEFYGKIKVLAAIPLLKEVSRNSLFQMDCSLIKKILES